MLIRSQNGEVLVSFDGGTAVQIERASDGKWVIDILSLSKLNDGPNKAVKLGVYDTMGQAQETLDEIEDAYRTGKMVFIMPDEIVLVGMDRGHYEMMGEAILEGLQKGLEDET